MGEYVCPIMKCEGTDTERSVLPIAGCHIYIHVFVCVCLCVYVCVCRRWLLVRTCYYCEYVCPIMKCEGTDTERPVREPRHLTVLI